jgi:hypothetical protein
LAKGDFIWTVKRVTVEKVREAVEGKRLLPLPAAVAQVPLSALTYMELPVVNVPVPKDETPLEFLRRQGVAGQEYGKLLGLLYQRQVGLMPKSTGKQASGPGDQHTDLVLKLILAAQADLRTAYPDAKLSSLVTVDLEPMG